MRLGAFVGRRDEISTLQRVADEAIAGRPRVAWIEGPAGAGKSALVSAIDDTLQSFTTLRAEAVEGADVAPMWLFSQLVADPSPDPFSAGLQLVARLAEEQSDRPVAIVVEDLHWVDSVSQQALAIALQRLEDGDRVFGVVTARPGPEPAHDAWRRLVDDVERCTTIGLGPLSTGEVMELAAHHGVPLTSDAASTLRTHTEGHPLHIRTLLTELSPDELTGDGPLPAPRSLAAATAARVSTMPTETVELVAALSVVDGRAPLSLLAELSGVEPSDAAIAVATATGLVEHVEAEEPTLAFSHPLHRAAVYEDLSPTRRRALHAAAATTVDDPIRALWHRVDAADHADEALAADLEEAARSMTDHGPAIRLLAKASDLSEGDDLATARALQAAGRAVDAGDVAAVRRMVPRLHSIGDVAERNHVLGWLAWQDGDAPAAERWLRQATSTPALDPSTRAEAWMQLGSIQALQSRGDEAIGSANAALSSGELDRADEDRAWTVLVRGVGQAEGGVRALELLDERFPEPWEDVERIDPELLRVRAVQHFFAGQAADAVRWFGAAMAGPNQARLVASLAHMHVMRAQCHHVLGTWDEAMLDANRAIELATDLDQRWVLPQSHAVAARVHAGQGRHENALDHVGRSHAIAASTSSFEAVVLTATARASIAHSLDDQAAVVEALAHVFGDAGTPIPMADGLQYWPMYVDALIETGRLPDARHALESYLVAASDRRLSIDMQVAALDGHLAVAQARPTVAAESFATAASAIRHDSDVLDRALLHLRHGRLLRSLGDRNAAAETLREGRQLLAAAHAEPYLTRFDAELTAVGDVQGASGPRSRFDLTDRERDVAALVVRGLTNKEAAAELYVSVKAVEYHLGNIYAKLGVRDRRELRAQFESA